MAYDAPTYAEFIARFPIFDDVAKYPQSVVELIIVEATGQIDTSWVEKDYKPAIMYLTAHLLATDNSEEGTDVEFGTGLAALVSESFAGMSQSFSKPQPGSLGQSEMYGTTVYGRRYLDLLRKNKPPVVVA